MISSMWGSSKTRCSPAHSGNVFGLGGQENIQVLGCPCKPLKVEGHRAEDDVLHSLSLESCQHLAGRLVVHGLILVSRASGASSAMLGYAAYDGSRDNGGLVGLHENGDPAVLLEG